MPYLPPVMNGSRTPEPEPPSQITQFLHSIGDKFKEVASTAAASRRPLPKETGNGSYISEEHQHSFLETARALGVSDCDTLGDLMKHSAFHKTEDDRELLLERIIKVEADLTKHDPRNPLGQLLGTELLSKLWGDLQHPPKTYLGRQFQYRSADGSNNNLLFPQIGAAATPYGRSVKPSLVGNNALPDPGVIFDSIMARDQPKPHENGISSVLFYLATIIIHDLFRTDHSDFSNSLTSSYLDLSPLYGSNQDEQNEMRTWKDGKIKPDCFSEKRILGFPPGVSALLVMFNRWHNYVVENLAMINEDNRFPKPAASRVRAWERYDEDLFQTGRLVTCGLYVNIILIDYVRTILNMNRSESDWFLDPRADLDRGPPSGCGNQVSAEFNLIYRWHSAISTKDVAWIEEHFCGILGDTNPESVPMHELLAKLNQWEQGIDKDPMKRCFKGMSRDEQGKVSDDDLVEIISSGIEDQANSFGARMIPKIMRSIDVLGMKQARSWNLASLNEFRQHFGLKKYTKFDQINPDPHVSEQLKRLYEVPDHVELYPGLLCEATKPNEIPGSGIMLPYTSARAILSDAVALVRGDRFYTTDHHPKNLTNWGFAEASSDPKVDRGCVIYKLFYNAFPKHFEENSVFAHFPLTIPDENRKILQNLGEPSKAEAYSFSRPKRQPREVVIESYSALQQILNDKKTFGVTWGKAMQFLMGPEAKDFMLAGDRPANEQSRHFMRKAMYIEDWKKDVKEYYEAKTQELIDKRKYKLAGVNQVDLIRDIGNLVHVHFCAEMFLLPLKTEKFPRGVVTDQELYYILLSVFICVFFDVDPQHSFLAHKMAYGATKKLGEMLETNVETYKTFGVFSEAFDWIYQKFETREPSKLNRYGLDMIKRLVDGGMSSKKLVWGQIIGVAGGMVPNQGQLFSQLMDYFFTEAPEYWPAIADLAREDTEEADQKLMKYMLEGSRLSCGSAVARWVNEDVSIQDGKQVKHLKKGEKLFMNMYTASHDAEGFECPSEFRLDRPVESYIQFGVGPHQCLGLPMATTALTAVLKVVARLPQLRPAIGPQGHVKKVPSPITGYSSYLTEAWDGYLPFPCSLKVNWDDEWDKNAPNPLMGAPSTINGPITVNDDALTNGTPKKSNSRRRKHLDSPADTESSPNTKDTRRSKRRKT